MSILIEMKLIKKSHLEAYDISMTYFVHHFFIVTVYIKQELTVCETQFWILLIECSLSLSFTPIVLMKINKTFFL